VKRSVAAGVALAVMLVATRAAAEPEAPIHLTVPTTVSDGAGNELKLAPGYFLTEDAWDALDLEVHRLQERETRLAAENESLRDSSSGPSWWWIVSGVAAGAALGFWAGNR
jgi:hypothetical protein